MATDALREVTVNGVRYFQAGDVERWHRQLVARAEYLDELEAEVEVLRELEQHIRIAHANPERGYVDGCETCGLLKRIEETRS